jgi:hypothetical protein
MREAAKIETALEAIVAHSTAMLAAAGEDRWEAVIATEATRRRLMHQTFGGLRTGAAPQKIQAVIRQVQSMDERVIELARVAHAASRKALGQVRRGKTAARSYADVRGH